MNSEAKTRAEIIDSQLKIAGWDVNDRTKVVQEYTIDLSSEKHISETNFNYKAQQFSDYVLLGRDGKPLAVVEAKKTSVDPAVGREQAKQYCYNIKDQCNSELPFCFYTNGHEIFFWDLENHPPRKIVGYPTRDDLERFLHIRKFKRSLRDQEINTSIAGRDYQIKAIRSVMEGIEKKRRNFLLVMATGTGKTRVCVALVDALMRAGHAERVLFLVDRIALQDQALNAFKEYLPDEPRWPKLGEKLISKDRRIYITTYNTMLNIVRDSENKISPHFFDLVVIDESHRSIYNTYQEVLNYFKAINLGLTATPTDIIDHNTFELFDCENGIPSFAYSYKEAVDNIPPYLCNFEVMKIHTKFQDEGINKRTISLEDQKQLILEGKEVAEINFEGTDLERKVTNRGTNALIVREFMEESIKDADGVLPGKTIFFCSTIKHARRLEKIIDSFYPEYCGNLAKVLVSEDPRVYGKGGLLDQFTNNNMPRIALSVDMLDTGVDVREIVNLVFAKPVYSYTKFWQMIGRGTRLLEPAKIKPWCTEKDVFQILDCWDNFEYFKITPKGKTPPQSIPLPVRFVEVRLKKIEKALDIANQTIADKEIGKLRIQIGLLPPNSITIQEAAADLQKVADDKFWHNLDHAKIVFLRNTIKPLFKTVSQVDFKAMRFQKDVLELSLARLTAENQKFATLQACIMEQISELPLTVNVVSKEETVIKKSLHDHFWTKATDDDFDEIAIKLAPLMIYRDSDITPLGQASFNFTDTISSKEKVEFGPEHASVSIIKYQEMVEKLILELTESNPILQKIKDGKTISKEETQELATLLNEEHPNITEELLKSVYHNRKAKFIQFIKHILGLEKLESYSETVIKAFEQFIQNHTNLSTRQLDFLNLLKDFILEKESVQKKDLIQSPFTMIHPDGIRGLFSPSEITEILELTQELAA